MKTLSFYPKTKIGSQKITIHDLDTPIKHLSIADYTINDLISGGYEVKNEIEVENKNRYVLLEENMMDEDEHALFTAEIPYLVENNAITNEDGTSVLLKDIWVIYRLENEWQVESRRVR